MYSEKATHAFGYAEQKFLSLTTKEKSFKRNE
jgi:hypothetical protein